MNGIEPLHQRAHRILVAIGQQEDLRALVPTALALAHALHGEIRLVTVTRRGHPPSWFEAPQDCEGIALEVVTRAGRNVGAAVVAESRLYSADLLLIGAPARPPKRRLSMGHILDPVVQGVACEVIVQRGTLERPIRRVLIPAAGGPNAPRAFGLARALAPQAQITALYVANVNLGPAEIVLGQERLQAMLERLPLEVRQGVEARVVQAPSPALGILSELPKGYDLIILGAGNEGLVGRFLFGDMAQEILSRAPIPAMVVRRRLGYVGSFWRQLWIWVFGFLQPLSVQEQAEIQRTLRVGARPTADFFVMSTLAASLAALGLLMDSGAIIIGAMIVAPLMTAILGMGLGLVLGDRRFLWRAGATTVRGALLAIVTGMLVGLLVPGAQATDQVRAFATPSVLDLAVALVAGAAAAYAICRKEVSAALAGVAVAASLTPPLVDMGLGVALREPSTVWGAGLMFLANLIAIIATGGFVFLWMGFRPQPDAPDRAVARRRGFIVMGLLLVLITAPLATLTRLSLQRMRLERTIVAAVEAELGGMPDSELVDWSYVMNDDGVLSLDLTLRVVQPLSYRQARELQTAIAQRLGRTVALSLSAVPTTRLRAYVPPTSTPAPLITASPTPTFMPTPTPSHTATPTPTSSPTVTATWTPTPRPSSTATPEPTATPWLMRVASVGAAGLRVRYAPDGPVVGHLESGETVLVLEGPVQVDGTLWYRVMASRLYLEGWVSAEYLVTLTPSP